MSESTRSLGFWSAVLATVFSLTYDLAQIAEWLGFLGPAGGPESSSAVFGLVVLLTPSLFLAPSFLVLVVCIHQVAPSERRRLEPFLFVPFDSFLYAVDILGYTFMSVSTPFAARVFMGDGQERIVRS